MALAPVYYPYDYHSVYRPVVYRVVSDSYLPPPNLFTADALIQAVRLPTQTEVDTYGLSDQSVLLEHSGFVAPLLTGQLVRTTGTLTAGDVSGTSRYPDIYRVERVLTPTLAIINAPYIGEPTQGGFVTRVLGNFTVYARIYGPNIPTPIEVALKPVLDTVYGQQQYVFELDARDILARHFKDVKAIASTQNSTIVNAEGYITMKYSVLFYEAYDVVSTNGDVTFTRFDKPTDDRFEIFNQVCVNAVHPYHHIQRNGSVDLDWADSFNTDFVTGPVGVNTSKRFLTYMDRDKTTIRSGESFFFAWMWQGAATSVRVRVRYGDDNDTILSTVDLGTASTAMAATSYICNAGIAVDTAPAGATKFQVFLINASTAQRLTEIFTLNIVPCKGVSKRWYYLNKLGGIDAFTFEGDETRQMAVTREIISKPRMAIPELVGFSGGTFMGDTQRRVWRTQPDRKYTITSGYMLPAELREIAEGMFESPNVFTEIRTGWWTDIVPITTDVPGDSNSGRAERFVIQYALGVDNTTQRT